MTSEEMFANPAPVTQYICFEGGEGCFKTTTAAAVATKLREMGYRVLETKEPGTKHLPVTMKLRELMLSNEYDDQLTPAARELISQAIRSIHVDKLIIPSLSGDYDFIIQDRGILSGRIYADECGVSKYHIENLEDFVLENMYSQYDIVYDHVFIFHNEEGLKTAADAKNEFGVGDAMESRGNQFHENVNKKFSEYSLDDFTAYTLSHHSVVGKTTEQIVKECIKKLDFSVFK